MFSNLAKLLPVGKVPTLPDVLNFAMLAKLLFQRCFVQKVELCQITRLSQRMAQKRPPACGTRAVKGCIIGHSLRRNSLSLAFARQLPLRGSLMAVR